MTENKAQGSDNNGRTNDVDEFIRKLHDGEIGIHPGAQKIQVKYGYSSYETMDIAQGLADAINDYEHHNTRQTYEVCKKWINFAYTHSVIITGASVKQVMEWKDNKITSLEKRVSELEKGYDALNEDYKKLQEKNISLKGRYEECSDRYDKLVNSRTRQD